MLLIEIQVQEVMLESITYMKTAGPKKLQEMMSTFSIINTDNKKGSKKIKLEENCDLIIL